MYVFVFIEWENIEKNVKQEFGSVLSYEEFSKQWLPIIVTSPEIVVKTGNFYFLSEEYTDVKLG